MRTVADVGAVEARPLGLSGQSLAAAFARLLHHFGSKGFWALTDQGVVSAADFLALNLLARWFDKADFGVYGVVLETLFWINALQGAMVLYPLTITGAGGARRDLRGPATAALLFTLLLSPLLCGGVALGAGLSSNKIAVAFAAAVSMLLWQLQETVRQALKTHLRFAAAVPGDCVRHLGQVVGIYLLHKLGRLDVASAFLVIGATSAGAVVIQSAQVGLTRLRAAHLRALAVEFWALGRWMLLAALLSSITSVGYLWVLQYYHGSEAAGVMGAIVMPLKITVPVSIGLASLIMPAVANAMKRIGAHAAASTARQIILLGLLLLVPYYIVVLAWPHLAMHLFLGQRYATYRDATPFVRLYVFNAAVAFIQISLNAWLGGLGQSRLLFLTQVIKTVIGLSIALPATAIWGIQGLILGNIFALSVEASCYAWFIRRVNRESALAAAISVPAAV